MPEIFEGVFSPNKQERRENPVNLSDSVIGIRLFKIGQFDNKTLEQFSYRIDVIRQFSEQFKKQYQDKSPCVAIITNSDLPESGRQSLIDSHLTIIQADQKRAERRSRLGKKLIGERSAAKGDFSYADMLNSLENATDHGEVDVADYIFASSDLVNNPEILSRQIVAMKVVFNKWQKEKPNKLAMVGSLLVGVHDPIMVREIINGAEEINLKNLHKAFPNNALSLVPAHTHFSGITDNALSGKVEINNKAEPIGGNEDFLYGFEEMLYDDKDCVLLIDPFIASKRKNENEGTESKYARRQKIYELYARRSIGQAVKRGIITPANNFKGLSTSQVEAILENVIDKHLFFVRVSQNGQPEIVLTQRQKIKAIKSPLQ